MLARSVSILCLLHLASACNQRRGNGLWQDMGVASDSGTNEDLGTRDMDVEPRDMSIVTSDMHIDVDLGGDPEDMGSSFDMTVGSENTPEACTDFEDNDGDLYVDCDDFNCCGVVACAIGTACEPGFDAGVVDAGASVPENTIATCMDGLDNDRDTYIDCNDFGCCDLVSCPGTSSCGMRDGGVDASTTDAGGASSESTTLACTDGVDNDGDMYTDCDDFNCCDVVTCGSATSCGRRPADSCEDSAPTVSELGAHVVTGSIEFYTHLSRSVCDGAGGDAFFVFHADATGSYTITTTDSEFDTVLAVYSGSCNAGTNVACNDDDDLTFSVTSRVTFSATAGQEFFVFVDAYDEDELGTFYVNISLD